MDRLNNLLGAQALALTDRLQGAGDGLGPPTERAALVTLLAHDRCSVSWLGQVVELTSSGTTRLVSRLSAAGWVTSTPGDDARSRQLSLTATGRRRADRVLAARRDAMADVVAGLTTRDRAQLERLLDLVVGGLADQHPAALRVCRLCDRNACSSGRPGCPLAHTSPKGDADG